jgi:hypothetical protein
MQNLTGKAEELRREFCGGCTMHCTPKRKAECYEWFIAVAELEDALNDIPEADV